MKKVISILIIAVLLASLIGCDTTKEPTITVIPQEEYDALNEKHMTSLLVGMIIAQDWQDANEVEPERFMYYFAADLLRGSPKAPDTWLDGFIPADELELFIQSRFDVTTEHLRTNRYYSAEKNAYDFGGLGSTTSCTITEAVQQGKLLTIEYDLFGPMDYKIAYGKLIIEQDSEDYRNSEKYKYISNRFEWSVQYHLAFPSRLNETDNYGVFMMDSGGRTSTSNDGINYKHYDGQDLASIIAFYENEALPTLEAQGSADTDKYEDGWYWTGTYRSGKPLTIDVQHRYGTDTYVIMVLYEGNTRFDIAENMRRHTYMLPTDLHYFPKLNGDYLWNLHLVGILDDSWSDAKTIQGASFVALYALSLNNDESSDTEIFFPAGDVESYMQRYFNIGTDSMRGWDVYDSSKNAYAYHPAEVTTVCRIVSATSYGFNDEEEATRIMLAYEITRSEEDDTVVGSGELTIELSDSGYKYISNIKHDS